MSRIQLFAALDGGDRMWSEEIALHGADQLLHRIRNGIYDNKRAMRRIKTKLESTSENQLMEEVISAQARFITPENPEWPHSLSDLVAPPIGLVVKGNPLKCDSIAIVGTRNPTNYGARVASEFASGFADRGLAVISGGAYGIDTHAHRGAIAAEGRSYAILASGVTVKYPAGNERLFEEILENGALVSEVMPSERARPERFLTRNRIIAALSRATIVVEAAFRSGSLRTARDASEMLRTVLAVPGPITSPTSDGCHRLIGERCAEIVTSVADAMELIPRTACTLCADES
ncbi:MAG: DNA-protecting protein DprA [Actinobacteria bacterium]|nr:DNA-protecting protein DprA [Actinomycetota bacterium]NDF42210.1 DNA-protecting protein DprA [Actinomycetota bacterium]